MPFKSKSQQRWMYANKPEMAEEWSDHTPDHKSLPEKAKKKKRTKKSEDALETAWKTITTPIVAATSAISDKEKQRKKEEDKLDKAVQRNVRERIARQIAKQRVPAGVPKIGAYDGDLPPSNRHFELPEKSRAVLRDAIKRANCALLATPKKKPTVKITKRTVTTTPVASIKIKKDKDMSKREKKGYLKLRFCQPQRVKLASLLVNRLLEKKAAEAHEKRVKMAALIVRQYVEKRADEYKMKALMAQGLTEEQARKKAYPENYQGQFPSLNKMADEGQPTDAPLGSLQHAYVADAIGAEASARAAAQTKDHPDVEDSMINEMIAQTAGAEEPMQRRIRHGASRLAETAGGRMVGMLDPTSWLTENPDATLTNLIMGAGKKNPEREELVKQRYADVLKPHQDKLDPNAELTERDTPWHRMQQGDLANLDSDIAGHKYMRSEKPFQYWLNPFDKSGPFSELSDRASRRINAGQAYPDSTAGRFGMGLGTIGSLGLLPLLTGGEKAQQSLRGSAAKNKIYADVADPERKGEKKDSKGKKEDKEDD